MDKDKTPPLNYLYFYLTDGCNLKCRHCWIEPHYIAEKNAIHYLASPVFSAIIEEALPLGLKGVKLTGGEPLLHPEILSLLSFIGKLNLELTVETNGTLINQNLISILKNFQTLNISVSLDGAREETNDRIRNSAGAFRRALKGIEMLVGASIRPQIIFTLMQYNREEIPSLVKLAREIGAGSVKINCLQPVARGERLFAAGEATSIEDILSVSHLVDEEFSSSELPVSVHLPPAFRPFSRLFGNKGDGCSTCGILGILGVLADGSYALCGIGETVKEMIFGRATIDRLEFIWSKNTVLEEIRTGVPHLFQGVCSRCVLKGICLGSCLAQNFYRRGSLWAPFWFCEEAEKKGLFPSARLTDL